MYRFGHLKQHDLYCMDQSQSKDATYTNLELQARIVQFKPRFEERLDCAARLEQDINNL